MAEPERIRNITDLARVAGVSAGTVSRALADSPLIAAKTRERIQAIARAHDFRVNVMARNLRTQRTGAIGVVIPLGHETAQHISDPFFMALIGHLADALSTRGYDLLLRRVVPANPYWLIDVAESGRVDGVILIGQSDQAEVIDRVAERYLPLVAWGAQLAGQVHCSVGTDNRKGGELAARHLIERGARRLGFFGDAAAPEIAQRLEGTQAALAAAGLDDALTVLRTPLVAEHALAVIGEWLDTAGDVPDGIVAASDLIALSAMRALTERGHAVPGRVRVIGYDDIAVAGHAMPPLSTIRQDLVAGAGHLVDLLFERIAGGSSQSVVIEPQLVVRGST